MDGRTLPAAAKRGRPAKNAAVYADDGTLLLTEEQRTDLNTYNRELDRLIAAVEHNCRDAARALYYIGEIFGRMFAQKDITLKQAAELTGIDAQRAGAAWRTYKQFADDPDQLEGMTVKELMPLIRRKKAPDKPPLRQIQYAAPPGGGEQAVRESFGIAPLSGAELRKYRIRAEPQDGKYYLLQEGFGAAIPIASLSVDMPRNAEQQAAFRAMQDAIQCAMEEYYAFLERDEAAEGGL